MNCFLAEVWWSFPGAKFLTRLSSDIADTSAEGIAFRAISLFSTLAMTLFIAVEKISAVPSISRRNSKSAMQFKSVLQIVWLV